MRRKKGEVPAARRHKATNRGYVFYKKQRHYLGAWNTPEMRRAYRDWVKAWEAANRPEIALQPRRGIVVTVADLVLAHSLYAARHYTRDDGSQTDEVRAFKICLSPLVEKHADRCVEAITGRDIGEIVDQWAAKKLLRKTINKQLGRIKRVFAWGARPRQELVSEEAAARIAMVAGLQIGDDGAIEGEEVWPVPMGDLIRTLNYLDETRPEIAAIARFQFFTGARPEEAVSIQADELLSKSFRIKGKTIRIPEGVLIFKPEQHKTRRRGHEIFYAVGPEAQKAIAGHLKKEGRLFPCDYQAYYLAIKTAASKCGAGHWSPGQLRHNFVTRMDLLCGGELASIAVGHKHLSTTAIYTQRTLARTGPAALLYG